ncbi:MAG: hypothetical protein B6D61_04785 [Bacteroidetes bacterium 4484_249]|nr:MAG: hypothetical protein B6D61_04785 [Bacteroidetes bacterium 4484_249]
MMELIFNTMKNIKRKVIITGLVVFCLIIYSVQIQAQSKAKVENIDFYAVGSNLNITYDIVKAKSGESFEIWVKVITDSGKEIVPTALTGDVGKGVSGGPNKRIVWDVESDNAFFDEEITVEVFLKSEFIPAPKSETEEKTEAPKKAKSTSDVSVGKAILFSALLPGLGNRYVKGSGAQWLIGVAGYGLIAGSVVMNNSAYNAYEDYKSATTASDRDDYFDKAKSKNTISKVFAGAAIVVWVADLVLTGIQASKARKNSYSSNFSIIYNYDPVIGKPMVGINYRF